MAKLGAVSALSGEDRHAVEVLCVNRRTLAGRRELVCQGAKPEYVYILLDGWAARATTLPDGSRQITAYLVPGDHCGTGAGIIARLDHGLLTLTSVTVAAVAQAELTRVMHERPVLARAFSWANLVDVAILRAWMVNLGRRDAFARTAHLICELHLRLKRVGMAENDRFDLPLTQEELADALGLTSVHVNRTLQRLRTEGLIGLHARTLTILDVNCLRKAARFYPDYLDDASV